MIDPKIHGCRSAHLRTMLLAALLWLGGTAPIPIRWARLMRESARSAELNRIDRDAEAGGYYEGLIAGGGDDRQGHTELSMRLTGRPATWARFDHAGVARVAPKEFLLFELLRNLKRTFFGRPFTTNNFGMRDRNYSVEKPEGTIRIALLGASIDMGWGVGTNETYENQLEDWLNKYAVRRGLKRRFEVLNFAVAAYGPAQRYDVYRNKVKAFHPDLVVYAATLLDPRLQQIHLRGLLRGRLDPKYDFLKSAIARAALDDEDVAIDLDGDLKHKDRLNNKLDPLMWDVEKDALAALVDDTRSTGIAAALLIIPRVGKIDSPENRAAGVDRLKSIARDLGLPVVDASGAFDRIDSSRIEIAPMDDHPNALGHKAIYKAIARVIATDPAIRRVVLGDDSTSEEKNSTPAVDPGESNQAHPNPTP
jgi:hypothetical protein